MKRIIIYALVFYFFIQLNANSSFSHQTNKYCKNEYESLSILKNSSDLIQIDINVPPSGTQSVVYTEGAPEGISLDLYWQYPWHQSGIGKRKTGRYLVNELLLKEKLPDRLGSYSNRQYIPPDIRLNGHVLLPEGAHRLFLKIRTSRDVPTGVQECKIILKNSDTRVIKKICIEVLNEVLPEPDRDFIIYYRGARDKSSTDHVSEIVQRKELQDIKDHGFTGFTIYDKEESIINNIILYADSIGLNNPIVIMKHPNGDQNLNIQNRTNIVFYGADEPNSLKKLESHKKKVEKPLKQGFSAVTAIDWRWFYLWISSMPDHSGKIIGNLRLGKSFRCSHAFELSKNMSETIFKNKLYYYWPLKLEKPLLHRLLSGLALFVSGFDGVFPYVYRHAPGFPFDPYNDFQPYGADGENRYMHIVYPSLNGTVSTIQWESLSQGIIDYRHLQLLQSKMSSPETKNKEEIMAFLKNLKDKISICDIEINAPDKTKPLDFVNDEYFKNLRDKTLSLVKKSL